MIRKIRARFIRITIITLAVTMLLLTLVINGVNRYFVYQDLRNTATGILENGGRYPSTGLRGRRKRTTRRGFLNTENAGYETRYFSVLALDDEYVSLDMDHISSIDSEDALGMAKDAAGSGKDCGYMEDFFYAVRESASGRKMYCFVECADRIDAMNSLLWISIAVCAVFIALALLFAAWVSRRAIQPLVDNIARQKQFITDAGHELKTPLTVMSADLDLLEMENGSGEWTQALRKQVGRMRRLVGELVLLSRLDEEGSEMSVCRFDLTAATREVAESFAMMAEATGRPFSLSVEEELHFVGDEASIRRLFSVLLENAFKYAVAQSEIRLIVAREGRRIRIETRNRVSEIYSSETLERLFDRFYRADASRSREEGKSGSGIGLAIARAIVQRHGGSISAHQEGEEIRFVCLLPAT